MGSKNNKRPREGGRHVRLHQSDPLAKRRRGFGDELSPPIESTSTSSLEQPATAPKEKAFRIQYKTLGITYSRCDLSREDCLKALQLICSKWQLNEYYIAQETHKPTEDDDPDETIMTHLHVWLDLSAKSVDIKNCRAFDISNPRGGVFHPNIKKASKNWIFNYLKKQDATPLTNIPDNFIRLAIAGKVTEAISQFIDIHPKDYAIHKDIVNRNLHALGHKEKLDHIYPLSTDYDLKWDHTSTSLHLVGPSGVGKTEFIKSYITHKLKLSYFFVTHMDTLLQYNKQDVIIWDDMSFAHLPRTSCIHIAESRNSRSLHCRHRIANIPAGVVNVFISNDTNIWPYDEYGAISRRVTQHVLPASIRFYKQENQESQKNFELFTN